MEYRKAYPEDVEKLLDMAARFYGFANLSDLGLKFKIFDTRNFLTMHVSNPAGISIVAIDTADETQSGPVGMYLGIMQPWLMSQGQLFLSEIIWYLDEEHRGKGHGQQLYETALKIGQGQGADFVVMTAHAGLDQEAMQKFCEKRGFKLMESLFIREI